MERNLLQVGHFLPKTWSSQRADQRNHSVCRRKPNLRLWRGHQHRPEGGDEPDPEGRARAEVPRGKVEDEQQRDCRRPDAPTKETAVSLCAWKPSSHRRGLDRRGRESDRATGPHRHPDSLSQRAQQDCRRAGTYGGFKLENKKAARLQEARGCFPSKLHSNHCNIQADYSLISRLSPRITKPES